MSTYTNDKKKYRIRINPMMCFAYILSLASFGFAYYFFQSHLILTAIFIFVLFPVFSGLCARKNAESLGINAVMYEEASGQITADISLDNPTYFPIPECKISGRLYNVFYDTGGDIELEMAASPMGSERLKINLTTNYSGSIRIKLDTLRFNDIIALVRYEIPIECSGSFCVLPDAEKQSQDDIVSYEAGISEAEESLSSGNDFAEVTDVREYIPGDRLKDIHWKLTAKTDSLMVKQRSNVSQSQIILVLDITGDRTETEEVVRLGYSIARSFVDEKVPVKLLWWNEDQSDFDDLTVVNKNALSDCFKEMLYKRKPSAKVDIGEMVEKLRPGLQAYCLVDFSAGARGEVVSHV